MKTGQKEMNLFSFGKLRLRRKARKGTASAYWREDRKEIVGRYQKERWKSSGLSHQSRKRPNGRLYNPLVYVGTVSICTYGFSTVRFPWRGPQSCHLDSPGLLRDWIQMECMQQSPHPHVGRSRKDVDNRIRSLARSPLVLGLPDRTTVLVGRGQLDFWWS